MGRATRLEAIYEPWVWTPEELAGRKGWSVTLDDAARAELDRAVETLLGSGKPVTATTASDFPLPTLSPLLDAASAELCDGTGIALIRGLPVKRHGRSGQEALLWGIGAHLGTAESQSYRGDMIGDVMDMSHTGDIRRSYRSPRPLTPHVDPVDVVGLMCVRSARSGGQSLVTSAMRVHNTILQERPDLIPFLYRGYHYRHSEAESSGEEPTSPHRVPVFKVVGDRMVCNFNASPIRRSLAEDDIGEDPRAIEALDFFIEVATRETLTCRMDFAPGDLQFLNNRVILHGRTEFEDWPEPDRKRHLMRLWLTPDGWADWPADMRWRPAGDVRRRGHPKHETATL